MVSRRSGACERVSEVQLDAELLSPHAVRWSPDSSRLVHASDPFSMRDGDLELVIPQSGEQRTLTPGAAEYVSFSDDTTGGPIDITPLWVDRETIVFQRATRRGEWQIRLYEISAEGGAAKLILNTEIPDLRLTSLAFSPETGMFFFTSVGPAGNSETNGIWTIAPEQTRPRRMFANNSQSDMAMLDVAFDGRYLVAVTVGHFDLRNANGEVPLIVEIPDGDGREFVPPGRRLRAAAFSPDGSKLLYVHTDASGSDGVLAVRDSDWGEEHVLLRDLPQAAPSPVLLGGTSLFWAQNDLVLLVTAEGRTARLIELR